MPIKNVYNKKKVTGEVVDTSTGEVLSGATSVNVKNSRYSIITSDEYITIDSKALQYISHYLGKSELADVLTMCDMVKGKYNLLHTPEATIHDKKTLQKELKHAKDKFNRFMRKLFQLNIIYYLVGYDRQARKKRTNIMLNPHLARKSKMFENDCLCEFNPLFLEDN